MSIFSIRHKIYRQFEKSAFNINIFLKRRKNINIKIGGGSTFYGIPRLRLMQDTELTIGLNCILRSKPDSNPIGVDQPVTFCTLKSHARIVIGDSVGISGGTICARESISIGEYSLIGANCYILDNDFHPLSPNERIADHQDSIKCAPITIGKNVFIGARSLVLKGVSIGDNAVIGAGSVVTRSIPSNCIAAGNPCTVIKADLF